MAVVCAVNKFRGYLEESPAIIKSDHQPLMTLKSPSGRLARWSLMLQSFDIQMKHITGKNNITADTLSRPQCSEDSHKTCDVCTVAVTIETQSAPKMRVYQLTDAEC